MKLVKSNKSRPCLVICTDLFTFTGGIQRFNQVIFRALSLIFKDRVNKNVILSLLDKNDRITNEKVEANQQNKIIGCEGKKSFFIFSVFILAFRIRPETVILTHLRLAPLAIIIKVCSPGSKVWVVLHGFEAWEKINGLASLGIVCSQGLLSVSEFTKTEFLDRNKFTSKKLYVIYSITGHEWDFPSNNQNNFITPYPFILCVSRLDSVHGYYKSIDKTIMAIANLAKSGNLGGVHLLIVGEGDDRGRLENLAEKTGVSKYVHFTGRINDEDLKCLYANCEFFVLPSTKEGLGLVFLEAMAYGKPVIASQHGASKEIVIDSQTGFLVPSEDISYLEEKISVLIGSKPLREEFGNAGRLRYMECFSYQKFIERLDTALSS
jgi:phosphatidyl-myo-inositol dimannoside synthase